MPKVNTRKASFRAILWREFCVWIQGRKLVSTEENYFARGERCGSLMTFEDGSSAVVFSNYEGDYSELTPGAGVEPPTVEVRDGK